MHQKLAYIETFGCQMNERDSEIMGNLLKQSDYLQTSSMEEADLILINTCSIRAKAEQKVYSLLGRTRRQKQKKPSLIIAVAGCVAQQEGSKIHRKMPHVDIVLGTQHIHELPQMVNVVESKHDKVLAVDLLPTYAIPTFEPRSSVDKNSACAISEIKKFVTIMQGCNNFCTYCVVPFTRGRENSRPEKDILSEISHLSAAGTKEITLLGQNVNSYGKDKNGDVSNSNFPDLLRKVAHISGIERIRFTTSNPRDLSEELMQCFAEIDKLCPHFHLPVQSGSNRILQSMNRKYTIESYKEKVDVLRRYKPDIALSTDIIVGFPGETDEDFQDTINLIDDIRYHSAFSFKYSDRPNARSASFSDKIPEQEKSKRLKTLQDRQDEITLERNKEYVGKQITVMVEGESKTAAGQMSGRSTTNHIVNFEATGLQPGVMVNVTITEGLLHSLRGVLHTN
jgi:tRNA-2-methylthio-N6-dimethylallyladenosine synthase